MTRHLAAVPNGRSLDPVGIKELAEILAAETWVDMRVVPGGIAERVKVIGIWVLRDAERVQVQQFISGPNGEREEQRQWIDSDCIWWVRPTSFGPGDEIKPFSSATTKLQSARSENEALDAAFEGVAWYRRIPRAELETIARTGLDHNHHRYWVMLVYRELVDRSVVNDKAVTAIFGYCSPQPLHSARYYARKGNGPGELTAMVAAARLRLPQA